ncbi:hypothetical protein CIT37_32135 [Bradyrhizobium ottawaense]|uniref:Uncharacterized protein n=1 Tax=Bradyrhizobium ottawaense TaxID=931866 RepID=A0A2U8PEW8_9BRAD|nr:hypothetical protein [Bradyrhizobium ottawaense]AWL96258.1 hypothetical protein CIT37_32135 [Bradyrhizobium ottawaense]
MKVSVILAGFIVGALIPGIVFVFVGALVFGDGPHTVPEGFVYAAAVTALGAGWGTAEWAQRRFITSNPSHRKAISSIVGLVVVVCCAMPAGKLVGKWAAEFDVKPGGISKADRYDIINLVKQQCEIEAPQKTVFQGSRASRVGVFCRCYGDAVGAILTRADADFMVENTSMPNALNKRVQDLGFECLRKSGVL